MRNEKSDPPERLTDAERAWLKVWATESEKWAVPKLLRLEEDCLDHFRANGKRMKDWKLTVKNWVKNEVKFYGPRGQALAPTRPTLPVVEPPTDDGARELARRREEHRQKLIGARASGGLGRAISEVLARRG